MQQMTWCIRHYIILHGYIKQAFRREGFTFLMHNIANFMCMISDFQAKTPSNRSVLYGCLMLASNFL